MGDREVSLLLQECLAHARNGPAADTRTHLRVLDSLPEQLKSLLRAAADRKWPFVVEKWQFKQKVTEEDKMESSQMIRTHLSALLGLLRACLAEGAVLWGVAIIFLLDRLLYEMDRSETLLKIVRALHRRHPHAPLAPQILIRQARVYLNTGKLQKAELILSSLINNDASAGSWPYQESSDRMLVQAVSLQVRGQVLQKLGLWLEAAELVWSSLIGFYSLPQPDKKGIGMSFGLLSNLLISMSDTDFSALQRNPHVQLGALGERGERLLMAAGSAQMAAVLSQYVSLYVLTNVVAGGACLLCHSFLCEAGERREILLRAREALEIGLMTRGGGETVDSRLELHTFLKAAFCLTRVHRWLSGPGGRVWAALEACQEAVSCLFSGADAPEAARAVMQSVQRVKVLLEVRPLPNSDLRSHVPDSYRAAPLGGVLASPEDFTRMVAPLQKHHRSVCDAFRRDPRGRGGAEHQHCITAFHTHTLDTCSAPAAPPSGPGGPACGTTEEEEDGSSLGSFHLVGAADSLSPSVAGPSTPSRTGSGALQELLSTEECHSSPAPAPAPVRPSVSSASSWEDLGETGSSSYSLLGSGGSASSWEGVGSVSPSWTQGSGSDTWDDLGLGRVSLQAPPHCCFRGCAMGSDVLSERDQRHLLAGVCQRCLRTRLPDKLLEPLRPEQLRRSYSALALKYSTAGDRWTGAETLLYVGGATGDQGKQRRAVELHYLHQEQLLSSYLGKEYLRPRGLHCHLEDVERQMTAQNYVSEFNKRLYENNVTAQIFFIPSEVLLLLEGERLVGALSAEPFVSGAFIKLTNNTTQTRAQHQATQFAVAFSHFTLQRSGGREVVVDLQGWTSADGKGLTYLTDPQIHSLLRHGPGNFRQSGIDSFIRFQHGEECNHVCRAAGLTPIQHPGPAHQHPDPASEHTRPVS